MWSSDTDTFSYHLQLWLNNRSTGPSTPPATPPVSSLIEHTLPVSFGQLESVQTHCLCLCLLTLRRNIIWRKTDLTDTSNYTDAPLWNIFLSSPTFRQTSAIRSCQPIFYWRPVESNKTLLISSLILCSIALWQDAEAPCSDFKCQLF